MNIDAKLVKSLRDKTGAGMMNCRKALQESEGDLEKAVDWLRKQGIAKAAKRSSRAASEGIVSSYVHLGGKIGVIVEINCETDFVARTDEFKELGHEIAMQIAATSPLAVSREDLPKELIEKERSLYVEQAKESGKPEKIWDRIADGKLEKFFKDTCLVEQTSIRDSDHTVEEMVKALAGKLGENIVVRRFARFQIGDE
jgi:elongation factor Ts